MKRLIILTIGISMLIAHELQAQTSKYPNVEISDIDGQVIPFNCLLSMKKDVQLVILFWKMNDPLSDISLVEFMEQFQDSINLQNSRFVLLIVDHIGSTQSVKVWKFGKAIDLEVYIDRNGSARQQFGIANTPQIVLFDSNGEIACQLICHHEIEPMLLYEKIKNLKALTKQ
jgi:hypothetical protein